jgi:hypothetical protein
MKFVESEIPPELKQTSAYLNALAEAVDTMLNGNKTPAREKPYGFALLVYPVGHLDQGHINYIGTGDRKEVLAALKEITARWEGRMHDMPEAKQ